MEKIGCSPHGLSGCERSGARPMAPAKRGGWRRVCACLFFVDCESGSGASLGAQGISGGFFWGLLRGVRACAGTGV